MFETNQIEDKCLWWVFEKDEEKDGQLEMLNHFPHE